MPDDPRLCEVVRLLHEYVGSPSLRHIRQPDVLHKLALEILLREERNVANRARIEAERVARLNRLMSGADCPWTQADAAETWHSQRNGRLPLDAGGGQPVGAVQGCDGGRQAGRRKRSAPSPASQTWPDPCQNLHTGEGGSLVP